MTSRVSRTDTGFGVSFIASAVIHLTVFLLLAWWGLRFPPQLAIQETYYVDVVNLPVNDPRSGSSTQKPGEGAVPSPPMMAPTPSTLKSIAKSDNPAATQEASETESAFNERMAKLERSSEIRREEEVLEKIRSKVKAGGNSKTGMPGTGGVESGSRYADFIKSRLEDALKVTSYYTTSKPEVAVKLTISEEGRLLRMRVERSSGDAAFELAVRRAIDLASDKFTAPPDRSVFENGFVFRPKGITKVLSR